MSFDRRVNIVGAQSLLNGVCVWRQLVGGHDNVNCDTSTTRQMILYALSSKDEQCWIGGNLDRELNFFSYQSEWKIIMKWPLHWQYHVSGLLQGNHSQFALIELALSNWHLRRGVSE